MLTAILSLLLFICIGIMTYLILSRQSKSKKGINIGMNVDINKLQNSIIVGELLKIADNLGKVQPLLCKHYKDKLRDYVKEMYKLNDDFTPPHPHPHPTHEPTQPPPPQHRHEPISCADVKAGTEVMLGQLIRLNDDYPMTGKLGEINKSIIASIKKIAEEVSNIICNKSINKVDKNKALKLLERGVNMICNIGYKNDDYL